jgi:hypothetical protein
LPLPAPHRGPLNETLRASLLLVATALLLTGCGGGGNSKEARDLLRKGFGASIGTANISIDLTAQLDGIPQQDGQGPVRIKLAGPYRSNGRG